MDGFDALLFVASIAAGIIASIAGFGIGSVLTPLLALSSPMGLAVAAVSIPHFVATAYRAILMRSSIDLSVLRSFGLMSAAGGLVGALLLGFAKSAWLSLLLAGLMAFVAIGSWAGWLQKMRFEGVWAWVAGGLSGVLGGLVGNQGGIRAGAMLGLGVSKEALVATATAIGVVVDAVRMPVYLLRNGADLLEIGTQIAVCTMGVMVGTAVGKRVLDRMSERVFRHALNGLLLMLAGVLAVQAVR